MLLTDLQKGQIAFELGYGNDLDKISEQLIIDFNVYLYQKIVEILERLTEIETARRSSIGDTMATKVGTIELSYSQHYKTMFFEGANLIDQLAELIGLTPGSYTNRYAANTSCGNGCKVTEYESLI